jgi:hypothetical protein
MGDGYHEVVSLVKNNRVHGIRNEPLEDLLLSLAERAVVTVALLRKTSRCNSSIIEDRRVSTQEEIARRWNEADENGQGVSVGQNVVGCRKRGSEAPRL